MRILQLMSFQVDLSNENLNSFPSHNLFGYNSLNLNDIKVDWVSPEIIQNKFVRLWIRILGANAGKAFLQLKCVFLSKDYDIIYSGHDMHLIVLGLMRKLRICQKPVFVLCHFSYNLKYVKSYKSRLFKRIERYIVFNGVDKLVFANERLYRLACDDFKVPHKHSKFLNWGADINFFSNINPNVRIEKSEYFAAAGTANRDYKTLISAFYKLPSYNLKIFGRLGEKLEIDDGKDHNIKFYDLRSYGTESMKVLAQYYLQSTAILIPILQENDVPNGATVLVEALAVGKPIIITDFDTNYIDVEKEGVGLKVKQGDIDGWTSAIKYLSSNPQLVQEMGIKARLLAENKFNYTLFSNRLIEEIQSID